MSKMKAFAGILLFLCSSYALSQTDYLEAMAFRTTSDDIPSFDDHDKNEAESAVKSELPNALNNEPRALLNENANDVKIDESEAASVEQTAGGSSFPDNLLGTFAAMRHVAQRHLAMLDDLASGIHDLFKNLSGQSSEETKVPQASETMAGNAEGESLEVPTTAQEFPSSISVFLILGGSLVTFTLAIMLMRKDHDEIEEDNQLTKTLLDHEMGFAAV